MQNYHRHTSYSNAFTPDSAARNEDYAKRAVELGHKIISSVEHGWQGYYFQTYELAHKYDLKMVFGAEAYWVEDRHENDKSNKHIILLARNENGRQAINDILSEANISGYYYKPRIDLELLLSLPADDVFVTSACIAFHSKDKDKADERAISLLHDHFGKNFMLEIQYHNTDRQKDWNIFLSQMSEKYSIEMIVGLDSHYIYPEQAADRDDILAARKMHYDDEDGWFMDYPDDKTVMDRFAKQGIFSQDQVLRAMNNTDVCLEFDDYDDVPIFSKEIKLPTLYPDLTYDERCKLYTKLITKQFKEYMKNVPPERYDEYYQGVLNEVKTYKETGMVDYPLMDYAIVKDAVEHGGLITDTGRGSAVGYFTNTLCGFSKVDRFKSAIKLYPERFISKTRILETHSLPDIDLNVGNPEVFEQAQINVLGEDHVAPMIAFGTLKKKSAFKLYARAHKMDFALANEISSQIEAYETAVKFAEDDEKDQIDIFDYVSPEYKEYVEKSKEYWGIISDKKKAPSAYLLYQGNIRKEIGLIKCKSDSTKKEYITCVIDGAIAENYKFLKNDLLTVAVVLLIEKVFKRIGIEHFDVNTLISLVEKDPKVWALYANGYTIGINQCEKESTTQKCMKYKPQNVSELAAFIAAIRPGFKSMYSKFESRQPFSYGIPALDNIIQTKQFPYSFIMYQEQTMNVLNYAGFPMDSCYGAVKNISKKRPEKVLALKEQFIDGFKKRVMEDDGVDENRAEDMAHQVWQIISDACGYSFNCVSGDTLIDRGTKNHHKPLTVEEMYKVRSDKDYAKQSGHSDLRKKYIGKKGFGYALSMFDDEKCRLNKIVDIVPAGIRQTYEVKTKTGRYVICTDNHKFPTPDRGKVSLADLKNGDEIYCLGTYGKTEFDATLTNGDFEHNYPQKGQMGFQYNPNGATSTFQRVRREKINNKCKCEDCGVEYDESARFELHHIDFDRKNNVENNYAWLCCSCHKKRHDKHGRVRKYEKGIPTYIDTIESITPHKVEMTYDVEMADPAHTFVANNGLVVSNSAHAFCMALDSLYNAWQKANYPYEFYETLLQYFSDKGNKEKVSLLKQEMKKAFGITEAPVRFGDDNRTFKADKEHKQMHISLVCIKGISQGCANTLYKIGCGKKYKDFIDVLVTLTNNKVAKDKIDTLIRIGYFEEFGDINDLLDQMAWYDELSAAKTIRKDKAERLGISREVLIDCSEKETDAQFSGVQSIKLVREVIANRPEVPKTTIVEKMRYQQELYGYITEVLPTASIDLYYVISIDGKYKNKNITVYRLVNGAEETYKIRSSTLDQYPIGGGDIIRIRQKQTEKKWKKIDNEWKRIDEYETFIKRYSKVGM